MSNRAPIEPNDLARDAGHRFLSALEAAGLPMPDCALTDVMGGWAFYVHDHASTRRYAGVFCDNDGDIAGLKVDRRIGFSDADEGIEAAVEAVRWVLS